MRAGHDDRPRRGDECLVDIVFRQRHVSAVGPVEDHRRDAFFLDRKQDQCGQPLGIGGDASRRDAFARQLLRMKRPICSSPTRVISADFSPSRAVPMAMLAGQPPTDLAKERDILQPRADLLAVEIDRRPPDGDDVESLGIWRVAWPGPSKNMRRGPNLLWTGAANRTMRWLYETEIPFNSQFGIFVPF